MPPKILRKEINLVYPDADFDVFPLLRFLSPSSSKKIFESKCKNQNICDILDAVDNFIFTDSPYSEISSSEILIEYYSKICPGIKYTDIKSLYLVIFTFPCEEGKSLSYFYNTGGFHNWKNCKGDLVRKSSEKATILWQQGFCPDPDNLRNIPGGEISHYFSSFPYVTTLVLQFSGKNGKCECFKNSCFFCQAYNYIRKERIFTCGQTHVFSN